MDVLDIITADAVETKDIISIDGETVVVIAVTETEDPDEVSVRAYSLDTNDTDDYPLPYDYRVELYGKAE